MPKKKDTTEAAPKIPGLFITELNIRNYKRIEAMRICPETGKPIVLTGDNEQGKSSVLDAIITAANNQGSKVPLRKGAKKGSVEMVLSDGKDTTYTVKRRLTANAEYLEVTDPTGAKMPAAQTFLKSLIGALAFDPEGFVKQDSKKQVESLRAALGIDFTDLDEERQVAYEERTQCNRTLKSAKTALDTCRRNRIEDPGAAIDVEESVKARDVARLVVKGYNDKVGEVRTARKSVTELEEALKELKTRLDQASKTCGALEDEARGMKPEAETAREVDAKATALIDGSSEQNKKVGTYEKWVSESESYAKKVSEIDDRVEELTASIDAVDEKKADIIKGADMPVDGLAFGIEGVTVDGIGFKDLNTAKQWTIAVAVAMAQNPTLKVMMVREFALMNLAARTAMIEAADKYGYQLWAEKFQEECSDEGIHILDGSVAYIDGTPVVKNDPEPEPEEKEVEDTDSETSAPATDDEFAL